MGGTLASHDYKRVPVVQYAEVLAYPSASMRWLLEAFFMRMNSSALDLLVHVDLPVKDISEAVENQQSITVDCIAWLCGIPMSSWVA